VTKTLKVGFLGCGLIARSHGAAIAATSNAEITAAFDPDTERSQRFVTEFSPRGLDAASDNAADVIAESDAVYICTWTSEHPSLVKEAAKRGKAIFCEKPLAKSLQEASAMTETVLNAGVVNQVGLVLRHSPSFRWLHSQVTTADAGRLMNIVFRDDQYIPTQGLYNSDWRGDFAKAGGGTLLEHSVHDLDLLRWMMGPIASVSARMGYVHGLAGIDDQTTVMLTAESGAQAALVSVWHDILSRPSQRRVEAICERGFFSLEGDWSGPVRFERAIDEDSPTPAQGSLDGRKLNKTVEAIDGITEGPDASFVAAVLANETAYPDFGLALEAHKIAEAAYTSAAEGGRVVPLG